MTAKSLLESVIGEVIDTVKSTKDGVTDVVRDSKRAALITLGFDRVDSVATKVRKSILYFPVFVSKSVTPKYALDIAKGHQIKLAEYVRIVLTNENVLDIDKDDGDSDVKYKLIDRMRGGVDIYAKDYVEENAINLEINYDELSQSLKDCIDSGKVFVESKDLMILIKNPKFDEVYDKKPIQYNKFLNEVHFVDDEGNEVTTADYITRADDTALMQRQMASDAQAVENEKNRISSEMSKTIDRQFRREEAKKERDWKAEEAKKDRKWRTKLDDKKSNRELANDNKIKTEWAEGLDLKKINNFAPIVIKVNIVPKGAKAYHGGRDIELLIGIKTFVTPIDAEELIEAIGLSLRKNGIFLHFTRTMTGELNFITDFLLNISSQRDRYNADNNKGTKLLERLRAENDHSLRMLLSTGHKVIPPTSTILISMDDCERVKRIFNIDLMKSRVIQQIMKNHNLVSFIIVDETTTIVYTYEDGDGDYRQTLLEDYRPKSSNDSINSLLDAMARR